jgi:hypothetical protein
MEVTLPLGAESDRESQSSDSEENSRRLKVAAAVALAGISYDFG